MSLYMTFEVFDSSYGQYNTRGTNWLSWCFFSYFSA